MERVKMGNHIDAFFRNRLGISDEQEQQQIKEAGEQSPVGLLKLEMDAQVEELNQQNFDLFQTNAELLLSDAKKDIEIKNIATDQANLFMELVIKGVI